MQSYENWIHIFRSCILFSMHLQSSSNFLEMLKMAETGFTPAKLRVHGMLHRGDACAADGWGHGPTCHSHRGMGSLAGGVTRRRLIGKGRARRRVEGCGSRRGWVTGDGRWRASGGGQRSEMGETTFRCAISSRLWPGTILVARGSKRTNQFDRRRLGTSTSTARSMVAR